MSLFGPPNIEKLKQKKNLFGLFKAILDERNSDDIRKSAVKALGNLGDSHAIQLLIESLENMTLCESAAEALGNLGDPRAVEPLIKALGSGNKTAAQALGNLRDIRAVEPLIAALSYINSDIRVSAAKALAEIVDIRSIEPLLQTLVDSDSSVRRSASISLKQLGESQWEEIIKGDSNDFKRLAESNDTRVVNLLLNVLVNGNEPSRTVIAKFISQIHNSKVIEPFIENLKNRINNITEIDIKILGYLKDNRSIELLINALFNKDKGISKSAIETLGQFNDVCIIEPLIKILCDKEREVSQLASNLLIKIKDESVLVKLIQFVPEIILNIYQNVRKEHDNNPIKDVLLSVLPYVNLNKKIIDLIIESASIGVIKEISSKYNPSIVDYYQHDGKLKELEVEVYNDIQAEKATINLCGITNNVTNNILNLIFNRKEYSYKIENRDWSFNPTTDEWDSKNYKQEVKLFVKQKEIARAELKKRGNPKYIPEYFTKKR